MTRTRQNKLTVFLDEEELAMLKAQAERTGLNQSDVIRQLIRKGHNNGIRSKATTTGRQHAKTR